MSFGNMQAQQEQLTTTQPQPELAQVEQQHPLLSAISGNNYADGMERAHYPWHSQYPQHHQQHHNPYLQFGGAMMGAASNHNGAYAGSASSGHSGYGMDSSGDYDTPPSGSYSSYHPSGGGGGGSGGGGNAPAYPPPHPPQQHSHPHPPPHPPQYHAPKPPPSTKPTPPKKKKSASSVMSALTLLSFFFFVNMLQNCIKEHITDMNPTVMVLTAGGGRNRFNKLAEMNSREQTSTTASDSAAAASASAAQAVSSWQQAELVPPPSSAVVPVIVTPSVTLHTPYSSGLVTNKPVQSHQPSHSPHHHHHHQDDVAADGDYYNGQREPSSVADFYPNRTHIDHSVQSMGSDDSDYYQHHHYYPERKRHHYMDNGNGYSNGGPGWAYVGNNKRYSSSASLGAQSGVSSYTDNARYRHVHDDVDDNDDDADYDQRYSHRHRNDDVAYADRGPHRRNGDSFYTRNN